MSFWGFSDGVSGKVWTDPSSVVASGSGAGTVDGLSVFLGASPVSVSSPLNDCMRLSIFAVFPAQMASSAPTCSSSIPAWCPSEAG